jgi:hypothetical protein
LYASFEMADNDDGRLGFDMLRFIKMRDRSASHQAEKAWHSYFHQPTTTAAVTAEA